jgi:tetratricopeptide (TPR) repeat protein
MKKLTFIFLLFFTQIAFGQFNTNNAINTGRSKLYFGNYVSAIENFNMVIKVKPYLPEPYFYRGVAKLELDDFRGAKNDLDKALEIKPYFPDAIMYRGVANYNLKDFKAAMEDYSKAIELGGETADLLNNRGICKASLRDFEGAIEDYTRSIRLKTKNFNAYLNRSIAYQTQKQWDKSIADCNQLIRIRPNSPMGYISRGLVKIEKEDFAGALRDFDVAVSFDPNNAFAFQNRGMVKQELGSYEAAIMDYDEAIRLDPYMASAYFNRGIAKEMLGKPGCQKDYDTAALLDPRYQKRPWQTQEERDKDQKMQQQQIAAFKQAKQSGKKATPATSTAADSLAMADSPEKNIDKDDLRRRKMIANLAVEDNREKPVFAESDDNLRVQDKNVDISLLPNFEISSIDRDLNDIEDIGYFNLVIDNLNAKNNYDPYLTITGKPLKSPQAIEYYKNQIQVFNEKIDQNKNNSDNYLLRGFFYSLTEEYNKALSDYDMAIKLNERNLPAYFMRANTRSRMIQAIELQKAAEQAPGFLKQETATLGMNNGDKKTVSNDLYSDVLTDLSVVLYMNPEFIFGYFNRGNIYCKSEKYYQAVDEYNRALEIEPEFAEAYYNRGLVKVLLNDIDGGAKDLSRAGELGIAEAYNVLKRYCN